jgi:hypothetical protein
MHDESRKFTPSPPFASKRGEGADCARGTIPTHASTVLSTGNGTAMTLMNPCERYESHR